MESDSIKEEVLNNVKHIIEDLNNVYNSLSDLTFKEYDELSGGSEQFHDSLEQPLYTNIERFKNSLQIIEKVGFFRRTCYDEYKFHKKLSKNVSLAYKNNELYVIKNYNIDDEFYLNILLNISYKFHNFPHILSINGICEKDNIIYIEYPYYRDGTIIDWCKSNKFDIDILPKFFRDMSLIVYNFHKFGIISNITIFSILVHYERIFLFNLEKCIETNEKYAEFNISKSIFIAPEVKKSTDFSFKTDIYGLGICFLYIYKRININETKSIKDQIFGIPENLAKLILEMTNFNPKKRPTIDNIMKNSFLNEESQCKICYKNVILKHAITCSKSKEHYTCRKCFSKYAKSSEFDSLQQGLKCPIEKCGFSFKLSTVFQHLYRDETDIIYEKLKNSYIKNSTGEIQKNIAEIYKSMYEKFKEYADNRLEYIKTKNKESGKKVLEYLINEYELENNANIRICPTCRIPIYKSEGCSYVICGKDYHSEKRNIKGCASRFDWNDAPHYKSIENKLEAQIRLLKQELRINVQ